MAVAAASAAPGHAGLMRSLLLLALALMLSIATAAAATVSVDSSARSRDVDSSLLAESFGTRQQLEGAFSGGRPRSVEFDIDVLHTTDIHGWIHGHAHNPRVNASLADVLGMAEILKKRAAAEKTDLFLLDTGDLTEGTGLSDATPTHGQFILEMAMRMPYDFLTVGNHDLEHADTIALLQGNFSFHWGGSFVTSNVLARATGRPLGGSHFMVTERPSGLRALVFGFLYNFTMAADTVEVVPIETSLQQPYFKAAMRAAADVDLVFCLCHLADTQPEFMQIYGALRTALPHKALVFLTGHTHMMKFERLDGNAVMMQSDHYLLHIGRLSFRLIDGVMHNVERHFVPANTKSMAAAIGVIQDQLRTRAGHELQAAMDREFSALGLGQRVACCPETYSRALLRRDPRNLYGLFIDKVLPELVFPALDPSAVPYLMMGQYYLRDNLHQGNVTVDDLYSIIPFTEDFCVYPHIVGGDLAAFKQYMYTHPYGLPDGPEPRDAANAPNRWLTSLAHIDAAAEYHLVSHQYDCRKFRRGLAALFKDRYPEQRINTTLTPREALKRYVQLHFPCT